MKVHIVQINESLKDIARKYDLTIEDIIKNNQHISSARNILPGMKLKLPILAEVAEEKLRENMMNIQDYYPTLDDFKKKEDLVFTKSQENDQAKEQEHKEEPKKQEQAKPQPQTVPSYTYYQQQAQMQPQQQPIPSPYMMPQQSQAQMMNYYQGQYEYPSYPTQLQGQLNYGQPQMNYNYNPYMNMQQPYMAHMTQPTIPIQMAPMDNRGQVNKQTQTEGPKPIRIDLRKGREGENGK